MCGLVGIVAARGAEAPNPARLEQAVRALAHRGPDDSGYYVNGPAALGSTRLSIIDLEHGGQPMAGEDGSVVAVHNGEIWNHEELRRELTSAGHRFRTRSDTEVLVHGFEEWGESLISRMNGMFACAIWDSRAERLLLARDRIGKKPLYLAHGESGLVFGSDARSVLIVAGLQPELETDHLAEFLFQRYVGAPRTLFKGVEKLPPGHLLVFDRTSMRTRNYWKIELDHPAELRPPELRALLRDSVGKRLMSDVPLGIMLSGGVDSAAVLGLMREAGADSVASFTIGFADPLYDERSMARRTAAAFGAHHHELEVRSADFRSALPRLSWFRDEPMAEPSEVPLFLLAELAGRHVKVVFSGEGGDELFGGYPKYRAEALLRTGLVPISLARALAALAARRRSHRRLGRAAETLAIHDPLLRWASWFRSFTPAELGRLLAPPLRESAHADRLLGPLRTLLAPYSEVDLGRRMLVGDLVTYLPDNMLARGDKVLMGASLEGRMPLLDYRVIERVSAAPAAQRSGLLQSKSILRKALADLVPPEVLRGRKRGFPVPVAHLLLEDGDGSLERLLLSERSLARGIFAPEELTSLVRGNGTPPAERELKLFTLISLELWLRANVDEVRLGPPATLDELVDDTGPGESAALAAALR
jgi:asparagine synthase (glutamine-hydrolysing)